MKLQIVHINSSRGSEPYMEMLTSTIDRVTRPETEVLHRFAKLRRATDVVEAYPYLLNSVAAVHELVAAAAEEELDGAMIACTGDPGVTEARTLFDFPVVGPWEATLHLAASYGYQFGVITVQERGWQEYCRGLVVKYGLWDRCAGLVGVDISSYDAFARGFTDPGFVVEEVERQARRLVDAGASAIAVGSAGLSTIIADAGLTSLPDVGVPIFDSLTVGLKTLEMRVDLTRAGYPVAGRSGILHRLDDDTARRVRRECGYGEL